MEFEEHPGRPWKIAPDRMTDAQRALVRHVEGGPRGRMPPNLTIWLNNMGFAPVAEKFGEYVSQIATFTPRQKEIVILTVAAFWQSRFEWHFHQALGAKRGLTQQQIDAIWQGTDPGFTDPVERASWELVRALLAHDVPDEVHRRTMEQLGHQGVQDIVGLMGLYTMIAQTIAYYRVPIPKATE